MGLIELQQVFTAFVSCIYLSWIYFTNFDSTDIHLFWFTIPFFPWMCSGGGSIFSFLFFSFPLLLFGHILLFPLFPLWIVLDTLSGHQHTFLLHTLNFIFLYLYFSRVVRIRCVPPLSIVFGPHHEICPVSLLFPWSGQGASASAPGQTLYLTPSVSTLTSWDKFLSWHVSIRPLVF